MMPASHSLPLSLSLHGQLKKRSRLDRKHLSPPVMMSTSHSLPLSLSLSLAAWSAEKAFALEQKVVEQWCQRLTLSLSLSLAAYSAKKTFACG